MSTQSLDDPFDPKGVFPNILPRVNEIFQGAFSDCYFLAALIGVVHRRPWLVRNRLRYLGERSDGTHDYSICMMRPNEQNPHRPIPHWLCVSDHVSPSSAEGSNWVSLFEKAFAMFNDLHHVLISKRPGYDALEDGGNVQGFEALTGRPGGLGAWYNRTFDDNARKEYDLTDPVPAAELAAYLRDSDTLGYLAFGYSPSLVNHPNFDANIGTFTYEDGSALVLGPRSELFTFVRPDGRSTVFFARHAYAVMAVNRNGDFLLRNPHGFNYQRLGDAHQMRLLENYGPAEFWLEQQYLSNILTHAGVGHF